MILLSTVSWSNGKKDAELITGVASGNSDKAHHAWCADKVRFWAGTRRSTGSSYQALDDDFAAALVALNAIKAHPQC